MTVNVKLFAALRDAAGTSDMAVLLPDGASVGELRETIALCHPALTPVLTRSAIAVNHEYANDADGIPDGAEVAIIPPVSGG